MFQYLKGLVPRGPVKESLVVTLLVRESEVVQLLTMEETLLAVEGAFRSQGEGDVHKSCPTPLSTFPAGAACNSCPASATTARLWA